MRTSRPAVLLFLCALISGTLSARQVSSPPTPTRDPQALAAVQTALAVMGGTRAISQIQNVTVQGSTHNSTNNEMSTFVWVVSGNNFRYENDAADGSHTMLSNNGVPVDVNGATAVSVAYHVGRAALPFHLPAVILYNELNNSNYELNFVGPTTVGGKPALQVHAEDDSDGVERLVTPQDWYFDSTTGLPLRVEFRVPYPSRVTQWWPGSMDFSNFQAFSGILVPLQLSMTEGPTSSIATVTSATFNAPLNPSIFTSSTAVSQ